MAENGFVTWLGHATLRLTLPDSRVVLIDPWLEGRPNVQRLDRHTKVFSKATLPQKDIIVVFQHSPNVIKP